ncbi:MAG TPA: hypothetical protein VF771_15120, partial [Longimicrobiaceae bacterium]
MYRLMPFTRRALAAVTALSCVMAAPRLLPAQAACAAGETTVRAGDPRLPGYTPRDENIEMTMERDGAARPFGSYQQHAERTSV